MERRLIRPAQAQVQGQAAHWLPIVLHEYRVVPPLGKPGGEALSINRAGDRAEQEARERVPRVRRKGGFRASEGVRARGLRLKDRIVLRLHHLVTDLDCVLALDLGERILQLKVLARLMRSAQVTEVAVGGDAKNREAGGSHVGNAQLLAPVRAVGRRGVREVAPVVAEPEIVKDGVVIMFRRELVAWIDKCPGDLGLPGGAPSVPDRFGLVRITAEDLVPRGELMIDLIVRQEAMHKLGRADSEILLRARRGYDGGVVWLGKRVMREKVLHHGVDLANRKLIARVRIADPGSRGVLPDRGRIVYRQAVRGKSEIPTLHGSGRHVEELQRLASTLQEGAISEQKEGPVPSVV